LEFKPDVPTIIIRRVDLSSSEKSFLLWCWASRDNDERYILMSKIQDCNTRYRNITWYANYFGMPQQTMSDVFVKLRSKNIVKTKHKGKFKEMTYVNFKIFS